ncbi:S1 family peptidase [Streptomyces halobius]|uniref:S1 family peptidase n=1 Tax=Streptomyces halobius TaxID=2879846 RepID=A0ABY4M3A0_9ACTN|nr:S1 family peptidase [Streptomyces halobius]UQA91927.1 S1 family peptidase [Streptomyces halobius]
MKDSRKYFLAVTAGALLSVSVATGAQAGTPPPESPRYEPQMVKALAKSLDVSEKAAVERLDRQAQQQSALAGLNKDGTKTEGAFFNSKGALTVNAPDAKTAATIEDAGLNARVPERGQSALDRIKTELDAMAAKQVPTGISSWSVDLASDTVTVEVNSDRSAAARAFLKAAEAHGDAVRVVRGQEILSTQAAIDPGSQMTIGGGPGVCSVGYGAKDSSGTQYLVTAGHCIQGLPDLQYNGERFAKGENTRFALGNDSVDMGIAKLDSDDSITTKVSTWGSAGEISVNGSERAAPGADLCKSGRTTQWTCGKVESYNVSVTYGDKNGPDTVVTGLGSSSVCTEGGDSGGAYISGNQAQGMTSGGPEKQQCTGGVNSSGSSYFQPLDDALSHYGLTLNTN